jgi:type I restriction enzyme R subunit
VLANGVAAVAPIGNIEWRDKIRKVIAEEIPALVSADKAYKNAMKNCGKESARIEHNKALEKAVIELLSRNTPARLSPPQSW